MNKHIFLFLALAPFALNTHPGKSCCNKTKPVAVTTENQSANESLQRTFALIKPDAVKNGQVGEITSKLEKNKFRIVNMEMRLLTTQQTEIFYKEHIGKPYWKALLDYITSGPVVALMLE